jgi:hypothetical protein
VQDHDRPAGLVEASEHPIDFVAIGVRAGAVGGDRGIHRCQLDLDDPSSPATRLIDASVHGQAIEPGVEPVGISKLREIPPGSDQPLLDRIACELRVPEDEAGCLVQPHDGNAGKLGEGVMIASSCSFHESSLVHARLV